MRRGLTKRTLQIGLVLLIAVGGVFVALSSTVIDLRDTNRTVSAALERSNPGTAKAVVEQQRQSASDSDLAVSVADGALIAAVILFVLLAVYVHRFIAIPIRRTVTAHRQLAGGDLSVRLPVRGSVEIRELNESFNAAAEALERGNSQANSIERVLGDLTTRIVQPNEGSVTTPETVDLAALLDERIGAAMSLAEEYGTELTSNLDPVVVYDSSHYRLEQLIDGLLINLIKLTPTDGRLEVSLAEETGRAIIEIADIGIGIPSEEFERLFRSASEESDDFLVVSPEISAGFRLVRVIAETYGGRIAIRDENELNTTVRVELPLLHRTEDIAVSRIRRQETRQT